ncbi:MAG TPA: DUF2461 domain-containing protein, partial [Acidimicrobiales bacterium]|nr:DUF2461 domain-containing protein [Acidimicrobiales bacterium]
MRTRMGGMMAAMAFRGIPAEAFDFYEGLEADNSKAYWTEHNAMYDEVVRQPFVELLAAVEDEFGAGKIFRPNRDVRFSHDKTPYKTNIGAIAVKDGAVAYVSLSTEGLFCGSGFYRMDKAPLDRFRRAVADDTTGPELDALVATAEKAGYTIGGEALKRAPKGYDPEHPRARLLRHKGLYIGRSFEPAAWMGTRKALDRIVTVWRGAGPVNAWLTTNVGGS